MYTPMNIVINTIIISDVHAMYSEIIFSHAGGFISSEVFLQNN